MSKKVLFGLLFFFSFFFFFGNVKADTILDYTSLFDKLKESDYEYNYGGINLGSAESKMKEVAQVLRDNNVNFIIVVYTNHSRSAIQEFAVYELSKSNIEVSLSLDTSKSSSFEFPTNDLFTCAKVVYGKEANSHWDDFINYINEHHHIPVTEYVPNGNKSIIPGWAIFEPAKLTISNSVDTSNKISNYGWVIWDTNISIKLSSLKNCDGLKVGNSVYRQGAILPSYMSLSDYGKTYYSFTDNINTLGKSQVRFKFNIPKNKVFSFELNYSVTYPIGYDSAPYLEVVSSNRKTILPLDNKQTDLTQTVYFNTQINSFSSNIEEVNLVADFEWLSDKNENVLIHFDSEYPFTYEYVTEIPYVEVDWTGNYGIMLLPKLSTNIEHYYDIYSDVFFKGNYLTMKIFPDDNTNINALEEHIFKNYNDFYGGYKYYFHSNYNKYKMFFVNQYYQDEPYPTVLKYDSRYFVHSICFNEYTCETITNPNDVNDNVNVKPPDPFLSDDHESGNEIIDKILGFIYDKLPIIKQIPDVWGVFLGGIKNPQPPHWVVDLSGIGFDVQVEMDFTIFDQYRETIFFIIRLSATYVTFKKILDILLNYFSD